VHIIYKRDHDRDGSVAEWLACWTRVQIAAATLSGNSQFYVNMRFPLISYIASFSHISAKCAYRIFSRINWHFRRQFQRYLCFYYLFLIGFVTSTNRMAPSLCLDPCGTRWGSWFQAILCHISAAYLVFMRSAYFFQMPHKLSRTGLSKVVNECQVSLGFLPAKSQILIRTASFLQKFTVSELL